jgi:DNA helicase HerA-like ATPase
MGRTVRADLNRSVMQPTPPSEPPAVGRVLGTEDSTPLQFWVALQRDAYLQLDDVVVTSRDVPGQPPVVTSGVVTQVRSRHEGAQFASDVFLIEDGVLPAEVQESAEVTTTRVLPEVYVPPRPGASVHRADGAARDAALYFDQMDRKLPIGLGRDGLPLFINAEFLDGTRGAHVSISGISGVATKTSFATWLLYSLFRSPRVLRNAHNAKALIFSVKGEDLLFLDHRNIRLDDAARDAYGRLGLPAEPFQSVATYAPVAAGDTTGRPDVNSRPTGVTAFWWTLAEFCDRELLPFVFADAEDERNGYVSVIAQVATVLRRDGTAGADGTWIIDGQTLRTYDQLVDHIDDQLNSDDDHVRQTWAGRVTGQGTVNAFLRRLRSSQKPLRRLIRADLLSGPQRALGTSRAQVTVVDLHNLPERAQRFVVGVTLRQEFELKEAAGPGSLLFTMLDELNKYAPREGQSPIKDVLLDIAERGRSLGVILIGAQQTASEVERRIVANSSIRVVGRLDSAEAGRPEYGFLPATQRQRATLAKPGTMFVSQPEIPVPLVVEFPFPAWATRPSEKGEAPPAAATNNLPADPFQLLGVPDAAPAADDPAPF